jgi:hypothetical protein
VTTLWYAQRSQWLCWNFFKTCISPQRCQWLCCACQSSVKDSAVQCACHSFVNYSTVQCTRHSVAMTPLCKSQPSQIFEEFFLKLWIHEIWEVSLWFVLIGSPPHLLYKRGVEPRVKPGLWRPKIRAQLWLAQRSHLHCDVHSRVNDSAMHVTAVSMTPLNFYQNLHRCTAVSMTLLCNVCMSQRFQWLRCAHHSGVNNSTVHVTMVSMTPLCKSQRCQWHCCAKNFSDFLGKY